MLAQHVMGSWVQPYKKKFICFFKDVKPVSLQHNLLYGEKRQEHSRDQGWAGWWAQLTPLGTPAVSTLRLPGASSSPSVSDASKDPATSLNLRKKDMDQCSANAFPCLASCLTHWHPIFSRMSKIPFFLFTVWEIKSLIRPLFCRVLCYLHLVSNTR